MPAYVPSAYQSKGDDGSSAVVAESVSPFMPIGPLGPAKSGPQIYVQPTTPYGTIPVNSLWFDTSPITY